MRESGIYLDLKTTDIPLPVFANPSRGFGSSITLQSGNLTPALPGTENVAPREEARATRAYRLVLVDCRAEGKVNRQSSDVLERGRSESG